MEELYYLALPVIAILVAWFNMWFLFTRHNKLQRENYKVYTKLTELTKQIDQALEKEEK